MAQEEPQQLPEGRLIEETAKATGRSIRSLAANADLSDTRWRQLVKGERRAPDGSWVVEHAPALTLARMAFVVGLEPTQLEDAGRPDAASILATLKRSAPGDTVTFPNEADLLVRQQGGRTVFATANVAGAGGVAGNATVRIGGGPDEIDLIYASNMSAREKLLRIRQVLELRALAEAEETHAREKTPPPAEAADDGAQEKQNS